MKVEDFKEKGMIYFTESLNSERATSSANTFILSVNGREYIIDTSFGTKRYKGIKKTLNTGRTYSILCTHYHNDHIANNGRLAGAGSPIIYHENAESKVSYLRTNASGQILKMYRDMPKEGFLRRLGFFNDNFIRILLKRKIYSKFAVEPLLFITSYLFSLKSIGRIYSGRRYVKYLKKIDRETLPLNSLKAEGWIIDNSLYALEAPGHTDCHIVYYLHSSRLLVAGDSLNFLSPNDIQFGTLKETIETQKFLLEFAVKEKVEILCQGHYPPVTGNKAIINYISEIIKKHEHVHRTLKNYAIEQSDGLSFDELYGKICSLNDPVIKKLVRITFPRSTLVFLDVYLLKILEEAGKK